LGKTGHSTSTNGKKKNKKKRKKKGHAELKKVGVGRRAETIVLVEMWAAVQKKVGKKGGKG